MKALTIHPYYVMAIMTGKKTVELRTWKTDYRGDIVITSSKKKLAGTIPGHALCVVNLYDIQPMKKSLCEAADVDYLDIKDNVSNLYAWMLKDVRIIEPQPVKGKLSLWEYPNEIKIIDTLESLLKLPDDEDKAFFEKWYKPIMI